MDSDFNADLIAPCGMDCSLCIAYQFRKNDLNKHSFHRKYCPGCIPRGENCTHMADACSLLGEGKLRFCYKCSAYPCKRLKSLDKRYRTKYHMSMIANLDYIKANGIEEFLRDQEEKWKCADCGERLCCHNGLCMNCEIDKFLENKKYRWDQDK